MMMNWGIISEKPEPLSITIRITSTKYLIGFNRVIFWAHSGILSMGVNKPLIRIKMTTKKRIKWFSVNVLEHFGAEPWTRTRWSGGAMTWFRVSLLLLLRGISGQPACRCLPSNPCWNSVPWAELYVTRACRLILLTSLHLFLPCSILHQKHKCWWEVSRFGGSTGSVVSLRLLFCVCSHSRFPPSGNFTCNSPSHIQQGRSREPSVWSRFEQYRRWVFCNSAAQHVAVRWKCL